MKNVGIFKLHPDAVTPFQGTELSACYDICACFHDITVKLNGNNTKGYINVKDYNTPDAYITLYPDELALVPTGMIFNLPQDYHMKLYSRSGNTWKKRLVVFNQPAVIDSDYTNETFVMIHNDSHGAIDIKNGTAIAQCELCVNTKVSFFDVDEDMFRDFKDNIAEMSSRNGGFGSTTK